MKLLIASHNLHKIREYRSMLKSLKGFDLLSLNDFPDYVAPEEMGKTFRENAQMKAEHAASHLKIFTIADDSGLVIPALNNLPGIYSARYAGEDATDGENCTKLLQEMQKLKDDQRSAYYHCALCLASPEELIRCVDGNCEGNILTEKRGSQGFGYDPLFVKYDYSKTFAELDEETKNRISHRRKALDKLLPKIEALISS